MACLVCTVCYTFLEISLSGNHTTSSRSNSLIGQAHPSESCQVLTLTLWIHGQTLIAATSKLALFKLRLYLGDLVYGPNLRRPFLRACEFSKLFCNYFPTSSVTSGNHTTGSRCNSLVGQARPPFRIRPSSYSHLVDTGHTLIALFFSPYDKGGI